MTLVALALLAGSCSRHVSKTEPQVTSDKRTAGEAGFDPLGDPSDMDVITQNVPVAVDSNIQSGANIPSGKSTDQKNIEVFSVTVFSSKSSSEARDFKSSIEPLFGDDIKVDYQAPYYRVDVGRAEGFDQAQALLKKVKDSGFPEAWLVKIRE